MNAFDLVVTVAFGSILATILLSKDVALAEGVTAFLTLVVLQFLVAWTAVPVGWFRRLIKSQPTLLFYQGAFLHTALRAQRVAEEEVRSAVRAQGVADLGQVAAVVLETDGSFTVVQAADGAAGQGSLSALQGVEGYPPQDAAHDTGTAHPVQPIQASPIP